MTNALNRSSALAKRSFLFSSLRPDQVLLPREAA